MVLEFMVPNMYKQFMSKTSRPARLFNSIIVQTQLISKKKLLKAAIVLLASSRSITSSPLFSLKHRYHRYHRYHYNHHAHFESSPLSTIILAHCYNQFVKHLMTSLSLQQELYLVLTGTRALRTVACLTQQQLRDHYSLSPSSRDILRMSSALRKPPSFITPRHQSFHSSSSSSFFCANKSKKTMFSTERNESNRKTSENEKKEIDSNEITILTTTMPARTNIQTRPYRPLVVVLAGPTAVGKSDVASQLCSHSVATDIIDRHFQQEKQQEESSSLLNNTIQTQILTRGHVISADSVQVYKGVNIGANKPSEEEMERTPHHLVGVVDLPKQIEDENASREKKNDRISSSMENRQNTLSSYNAADWMSDAEYIVRQLTMLEAEDGLDVTSTLHESETGGISDEKKLARMQLIDTTLKCSLAPACTNHEKRTQSQRQPILPVVVGGTMMYLQWLVHGRPDAIRPTTEAVKRAASRISKFRINYPASLSAAAAVTRVAEKPFHSNNVVNDFSGETYKCNNVATIDEENDADDAAWKRAKDYVCSLGPVFSQRVEKLCGRDWYRLRRLLEVAYTLDSYNVLSSPENDEKVLIDEETFLSGLTEKEIYTGIRSGSLLDSGYDVRCFFLCPNDRMLHFHTVDKRCEDMISRGLLRETANLFSSGCLPEKSLITRAIGYRQAIKYLMREDAKENDHDAFLTFVDDFATATRQYAKKQMQWFRHDAEFFFVPVKMESGKTERIKEASEIIASLCKLPRDEFDAKLYFNTDTFGKENTGYSSDNYRSLSAETKMSNEKQGKNMKFFISKREKFFVGSVDLMNILAEADECSRIVQSSMKSSMSR